MDEIKQKSSILFYDHCADVKMLIKEDSMHSSLSKNVNMHQGHGGWDIHTYICFDYVI